MVDLSVKRRTSDAEAAPDRLTHARLYKAVDNLEDKRRTMVRILTSAALRLGGTYMLRVELSRKDIAELFFDTHKGAMIRMIQSFIEEEAREDRAQMLAALERMSERRRERLAQEGQTEPQGS
jgi:hypothetical protein